jgi:hypothetical protein
MVDNTELTALYCLLPLKIEQVVAPLHGSYLRVHQQLMKFQDSCKKKQLNPLFLGSKPMQASANTRKYQLSGYHINSC